MRAKQFKKVLNAFHDDEEVVIVFFAMSDLHNQFKNEDRETPPPNLTDEEWDKVIKNFWSNDVVQLILTRTFEKQFIFELEGITNSERK